MSIRSLAGRSRTTSRPCVSFRVAVGRSSVMLVVLGSAVGIASIGAAAGQEVAAGGFTAEQAAAGWATYARSCSECHGTDLRGSSHGPELTGSGFLNNWGARTTAELLDYMAAEMPPGLGGALSDGSYLNIVAYLLESNGQEAGPQALQADAPVAIGAARAGGRAARAAGGGDPPTIPTRHCNGADPVSSIARLPRCRRSPTRCSSGRRRRTG